MGNCSSGKSFSTLRVQDTTSIDLTYNCCTCCLKAEVIISAVADNNLVLLDDGLFATSNVTISPDEGNDIEEREDGLFVQDPAWFGTLPYTNGTLGFELLTNGTFPTNLTGWTATNWTWAPGVATHTAGNVSPLSQSISVINGETYLVALTYSGATAGAYAISLNGVTLPNFNTIETGVLGTYYAAWVANTTGSVVFAITPTNPFNGSIGPVSVKQVTVTNSALSTINDSAGAVLAEVRGLISLTNFGIGRDTLFKNVLGTGNTAYGRRTLLNNVSGVENTALGHAALEQNLVGSNNTAVGWNSLLNNNSGFVNTAVGQESLYSNISGAFNTAIGNGTMYSNVSGFSNIAIGTNALFLNVLGNYSVAIGANALGKSLGGQNTSIGIDSSMEITSGLYNVAVGQYALQLTTTSNHNNAFGIQTLQANTTGAQNTGFGSQALSALVTGDNNVALGYVAAASQTAGSNNICIGANQVLPSTTGSNQLNIGGTIYGNLSTDQVVIGATTPVTSSLFALTSTTLGFLPPRMTTVQRDAIATPAAGLIVYNSTTNKLNVYTTAWEAITSV